MRKHIFIIAILVTFPLQAFALSVGIVSDIHAGKMKVRKTDISTVYPKRAIRYFKKAVKEMKIKKVNLIISLGDNTQGGKKKYYKQLKKIENKHKVKILWVKGNHDSRNFRLLSNKTNYFIDYGSVRIIVVDTNFANINGNGEITPEGLQLYQEAFQTDKKIVLAMHHPPFNKFTMNCDWWNPDYDWTKNADLILTGHWHIEKTCRNVQIFPALTKNKRLNYKIIDI